MADMMGRAAAVMAAAIATAGRGLTPAELLAYANPLVPWITAPAARILITLKGDPMPITVDSVNETAVLTFADDHGDPVPPPEGTVAVAASSDPAVMTVGDATAGTDPSGLAAIVFPLTALVVGDTVLSVHCTAADGSPLLGPDGATPIPDADPVPVHVNPGAPAAERFTVPDAG